jgi:hypothetical protein
MEFAVNRPLPFGGLMTPGTLPEESPRMVSDLLNDNQARHLTAVLGLLLDDLSELAAGVPAEPWADAARAQIHDAGARVRQLLRRLGLAPAEPASPRRRLLAYAGIWMSRLHDLRAEQLSGYGAVADGLDAALNPGLDEIGRALEHLARLAGEAAQP